MFEFLDGPTSGSKEFKGNIGKLVSKADKLTYKDKFDPVILGPEIQMPPEKMKDLSRYQWFALQLWLAYRKGELKPEFKKLKLDDFSLARWLSVATRILVVNASDHGLTNEKDLENLRILVEYIIGAYLPTYFNTKDGV